MLQDPTPLARDDLTRNKLSQAEFIISWPHVQLVENEIKHKIRNYFNKKLDKKEI